jgi:hypothetical protein
MSISAQREANATVTPTSEWRSERIDEDAYPQCVWSIHDPNHIDHENGGLT